MTEYENYRIKEADYCECSHVMGSHAGKYFALKMLFMIIGISCIFIVPLSLQYLKLFSVNINSVIGGLVCCVTIYLGLFVIDKGCSYCTCKKFTWNGKNKYE